MKGDNIPDHNHVARCCMSKHVSVSDGQIQATAFMLRPDEKSLSVNWLEFFGCSSREGEITEIQKTYSSKFTLGARSKIAVLNVGEVCERVRTESPDSRKLVVLHDPADNDPSHSGIYNLRNDDELIAELILETVCETYPARK